MFLLSLQLFLLFAVVVVVLNKLRPSSSKSDTTGGAVLPPGPKPLPILGNILDLTPRELWLRATSWAKIYGDITYLHVFGQPLVFLNTPRLVFELLDKRGSIYSDKPHLTMVNDLCGCNDMVAFTGYGSQSKRQRRLMNMAFAGTRIPTYFPLITRETHFFIRRLLAPKPPTMSQVDSQKFYVPLLRRYAGQLTLNVVYGYKVESTDDPFLNLAEECVNILSNEIASGGGIWPVDLIPQLQYLPDWMPGSGFLQKARIWKAKMEEFVDKPYHYVKQQMKRNTHTPSFCSTLLENSEFNPNNTSTSTSEKISLINQFEHDLRWTANSMYSASLDTTMTTIQYFFLMMAKYPSVHAKARAEIDSLIPHGTRLPTFADRSNLPYCEALFSEILRHNAPVPMSLPHRLMEDDVFVNPTTGKETFLKKGSLIFANVYNITRDPQLWPAPESMPEITPEDFCPERHLLTPAEQTLLSNPSSDPQAYEELKARRRERDPKSYVFGFGRRQCPGQNLIQSSTWLVIVTLLASVDWAFADDGRGEAGRKEEESKVAFENSVFRQPTIFRLDFKPRSEAIMRLIDQQGEDEFED
ncbi:cytochrome P450 [Marasmius fiardii PR-910]|nr:cytochrome P450 [Marasmius fiardii PR-910]